MRWSWAQARQAATAVRRAKLGKQTVATVRPRGVSGLVRCRLPLSLLLYVASWDALVVEQVGGGFALLQRPVGTRPGRPGGFRLRMLRWLDRQWQFVVFGGPPSVALLAALAVTGFASSPLPSLLLILAALVWVMAFLIGGVVPSRSASSRLAASLPHYHWFVPVLHQPDPDRVDELLRLSTARLVDLMRDDLEASAPGKVRVEHPGVTETLIVLTRGITTEQAREVAVASDRAAGPPSGGDVIMLDPPGRLEEVPRRPTVGGRFLLWYAGAFALALVVWRFTDLPRLWPGSAGRELFGWLIALAGAVGLLVAIVAGRAEVARNKETSVAHTHILEALANRARVLILVTKSVEREAVLEAFSRRTGRAAVLDRVGERTVHRLGRMAGAQVILAQSSEQGTASVGGMFETARSVIELYRPDHVMLTGICFGLRPDNGQRIGDVVVASRVHNLDHRKVTDVHGAARVIPRGIDVPTSTVLLDRVQVAESTWRRGDTSIHSGLTLCTNTLADSRPYVRQLHDQYPDAIAAEMEAIGVYEASRTGCRPEWSMVKGISDWGFDKSDRDQPLAARNAAEFVAHVVSTGLPRLSGGRT